MMGSKGDGSGGNNGVQAVIPTGARKIVQSLKEIVSCSDLEIYAALKECNMDPNEAVNRILSQDPFHAVKSKREKKKEVKDTTDPGPRGVVAPSRCGRTVVDRFASRGPENAPFSADTIKATPKRENGSHAFLSSSSSTSAISAPNINQKLAHSDHLPLENKAPAIGENDLITSAIKLSSGFPRSWGGTSGQVSMADIVKMGKPQVMSSVAPNHSSRLSMARGLHGDFELHDQSTNLYKREPLSISEHVTSNDDDWPLNEQQAPPPNNDGWPSFENSQDGSGHQHMTSQLDGGHILEDGHIESNTNHMGFTSVSSRNIPKDNDRDPSLYDDSVYKNVNVFQPQMHSYVPNEDYYAEDDGVAAVSTNFEHLSLQKNEQGSAPEEDGPAVVIPDHLQVHPSDCQHLRFGSFAPNIGTFSGLTGSRSFKSSLAEAKPIPDTSSASLPEMRDSEHYSDEDLRPHSNGDDVHSSLSNESASEPEVLKQHPGESIANHYAFPSAASGYNYENSQALDSTFAHPQASSPMQNLSPFSKVQPSYTDPLPSSLLASALQTGRETDLSYLPFPVAQPMATKYNNTASSLNSSIMSTQEGFRAGSNSAAQQVPQNLPNAGLTTGPGLPQHLAMPAYSQPGLSLGHFASMANMVSYSFLPQSYSYMPSAFQQVFASNNNYHQSLAAAALPQYKSSLSTSNLPQSGAVASGYGLNSSSNVPGGNFMLNPPSGNATIGYEDALNSQYNDASNLFSLQQNDNSGMWLPGTAARTVPNLPASTYYDFQSQSQQPGGLRQAQQPSQHFSGLGYPNFYQSSGITMEQQQQLMRDGALGESQGQQQPKQSPQLWHNTY